MSDNPEARTWEVAPTRLAIAQALADLAARLDSLSRCTGQACRNLFTPVREACGRCIASVDGWIVSEVAAVSAAERGCTAAIWTWIEAQLQSAQGAAGMCDAAVHKHQKKLDKAAGRRQNRNADANVPPASPAAANSQASSQQADTSARGQGNLAASCLQLGNPFNPPPTVEQLHSRAIPMRDNQPHLLLADLAEWIWDPANDQHWWLSLTRDPLSRAQIDTIRDLIGVWGLDGSIWMGIGRSMTEASVRTLVAGIGVPDEYIHTISGDNAWTHAVGQWGEGLTRCVWEAYRVGIPDWVAGVQPGVQNAGVLGAVGPRAQQPGLLDQAAQLLPGGQQAQQLGALIGQNLPAGAIPQVPGAQQLQAALQQALPGVPAALMQGMRLPTMEDVCRVLGPLFGWMGIDPQMIPGCKTVAELDRYQKGLGG